MRKAYLSALERREAMLLSLVDRQVDIKQEILAEMRLEVATARARVLAAHEEGKVPTVLACMKYDFILSSQLPSWSS